MKIHFQTNQIIGHSKQSTKRKNVVRLTYFFATIFCLAFNIFTANAQLGNVLVTGFNNDVVANGGGTSGSPNVGVSFPANGCDGAGYCLVQQGYTIAAATPTCFMPPSNTAASLLTSGLTYNLQGYGTNVLNNNNALTITAPSSTYTSPFPSTAALTLSTPASYTKLYALVLSVCNNGATSQTMTARVNFTDATFEDFTGITYANWFSGSAATTAVYQFNRVNPNNGGFLNVCTSVYNTQPSFYELNVSLNPANYGKLVSNITFTSTTAITGTGATPDKVNYLHVFSVGGLSPCATPTAQFTLPTFPTVTTGSISGSFTAAAGAPNGYLVVRYPTLAANTLPANGTTYSVGQSIGLGTVVQSSASTSFNALGLNGSTTYDFYVYSYNSSGTCGGPIYLTSGAFYGTQSTNSCGATILGTIPVGSGYLNTPASGYTSLTNALADINAIGLAASTILELQPSYTTAYAAANETYPITLQSNPCINAIKTLTIRPKSSVATLIALTTNNATATINFNGGSNITIDGRPGGTGTTSMLSIANTNLGATPSVQLINDASSNIIRFCTIQSVNNSVVSGTIVFGSTSGISGNDNNTIDNCTISDGATTPVNAIYSAGLSALVDNSNNSITNCNISNFASSTVASMGILLASPGSSNWIISGNRLFQTATRLTTVAGIQHAGINIQSGSGYTITNNIVGFANSSGTGTSNYIGNTVTLAGFPTSYTVTGTAFNTRYIAINGAFTAGGAASSIQNNTVAGIALYTSSGANTSSGILCGINISSGSANIGNVTGNQIGSLTGLGSLYSACTTTGGTAVGIFVVSANTVTIQNNSIGGIDASGTTATINGGITGIDVSGTATYTITGNTIGNSTAGNLRNGFIQNGATLGAGGATQTSTTGATAAFIGIRSAATGSVLNITSNTLRGFITSGTVTPFTGINNTGAVATTNNINNNFFGTAAVGLINYTVANSGAMFGISNTGGVNTCAL